VLVVGDGCLAIGSGVTGKTKYFHGDLYYSEVVCRNWVANRLCGAKSIGKSVVIVTECGV
jgi:hypothetical protein